MNRQMNANGRPAIPQEEWDFSGCPQEEIAHCCLYEYARSSVTFKQRYQNAIKDALSWQNEIKRAKIKDSKHLSGFLHLANGYALSLYCPEFPKTPWLRIDQRTRLRRVIKMDFRRGAFSIPFGPVTWPSFDPATGNERLFVEICWSAPKATIIEEFADWLDAQHPEKQGAVDPEAIWKQRPAKATVKMLKALAAWRLLEQFGLDWETAADETSNHSPDAKALYDYESGWSRAKAEAEAFLTFPEAP